jgi:hypothetical protein
VRRLLAGLVVLLLAGAAAAGSPIERGSFRAEAFAPLPERVVIVVDVWDDSPENLELKAALERELAAVGLAARNGVPHGLVVDTRTALIPPDGPDGRPRAVGILRLDLVDRTDLQVVWEAEAVYEAHEGDFHGGALALVALVADTIGRTVALDTLDLY